MKIEPLPPTIHRGPRPDAVVVDTIVVHSMSHPEAPDPEDLSRCVERLRECGVSAHYFIDRMGGVWCQVPPSERAWHAGVSRMPSPDSREGVNDFSIGIELIAQPESNFTEEQVRAFEELVRILAAQFPIRSLVGHADIAVPVGRKSDPGPLFPWGRVHDFLSRELSQVVCLTAAHGTVSGSGTAM